MTLTERSAQRELPRVTGPPWLTNRPSELRSLRLWTSPIVAAGSRAKIDNRPFDAVRASLHRRLGHSHENRLANRAGRDIDIDFHGDASIPRSETGMQSLANMLSPHVGPRLLSVAAHRAVFTRPLQAPASRTCDQGDTRLSPKEVWHCLLASSAAVAYCPICFSRHRVRCGLPSCLIPSFSAHGRMR